MAPFSSVLHRFLAGPAHVKGEEHGKTPKETEGIGFDTEKDTWEIRMLLWTTLP